MTVAKRDSLILWVDVLATCLTSLKEKREVREMSVEDTGREDEWHASGDLLILRVPVFTPMFDKSGR